MMWQAIGLGLAASGLFLDSASVGEGPHVPSAPLPVQGWAPVPLERVGEGLSALPELGPAGSQTEEFERAMRAAGHLATFA